MTETPADRPSLVVLMATLLLAALIWSVVQTTFGFDFRTGTALVSSAGVSFLVGGC